MKYFLREREKAEEILKKIEELKFNKKVRIMEACGTHTQTIAKFGLRSLLPKVDFTSGPGCPVCVTDASEIDKAIELSKMKDVILTTFGDIFQVPGSYCSLANGGGNVKVVYSVGDSIEIARKNPEKEIVHFAIGFETTAPYTAYQLTTNYDLENFSILSSHRLFLKAFEFLLSLKNLEIDGFICPGHVSTITGSQPYEKLVKKVKLPMVIAGFEPNDILIATFMILKQLKNGEAKVEKVC
jgi:hydrogenase expression/formation protein HypD